MSAILEAKDLTVRFPMPRKSLFAERQHLEAVRSISFQLEKGRTLGIVGESGSGKTTAAMASIRLTGPATGAVEFEGEDLFTLDDEAMRKRRADIQLIFQDPYSSLNPRDRVSHIVQEPLDLLEIGDEASRKARVEELFKLVGLRPDQLNLFPHQFSGGQRQRISIARALATNPKLIVCDEPGLGPRCRHSGSNPEPFGEIAGRTWPKLSLHLTRPWCDPSGLRRHRSDVPWSHCRTGQPR